MKSIQRVTRSAGAFAGLLVLACGAFAGQGDSVQPAELRTYSTLHSIGIEWEVTGDADHDAKCEVRYRKAGAEPWRQALDLFRIDYYGWYGDTKADRAYNMLAGSILFLEPGAAYEVQLALSDADGGKETRTVVIATRPEPVRPLGGRVLEVVPGSGGGDGTPGSPFQGLASAQSAAGPGDMVRVHGGHYGEFTFDKPGTAEKRLAWVAAGAYSMEYQPLPDWRTNVDYDGFDWDRTPTPFWWELTPGKSTRFKDLASFSQTVGIERHALHLHKEETFEIQDIPAYAAESFSAQRLTLKPGCAALDAGQALPNVCDEFEGRAPDLGAYELGRATPHYGPRTLLDSAGQ